MFGRRKEENINDDTKILAAKLQKQMSYFNNIPTFVAVTDLKGKIKFCNEAPLKPLGLTLNDIVGKYKWDMQWWSYDPKLKDSIKDMILRSAKGESFVVENNPKVGKQPIPIKYTCSPLKDSKGNITEVILTGTPIIEQKQAMEIAQKQVTYLDNIPTFVAVTDLEGKIKFCNETPLKPLGLTLNDIVGKHKWDMEWWSYDPQLKASIKDMILRSAKGESFVVENNPKVGEQPIPIKYTCSPLKDENGNVTEVILTGTTIIEQKQAMEIAQRQVMYLDNIPTFVAVTDLEGKIKFCNETPLKPLGLTLNDIVGKYKWDMEWWSYDPQLKESIKDMILRSAKGESFVVENNPKVGESPIPIKYTCSPLKDENGNVTEVILTGTTIIEQKQAIEIAQKQVNYLNNIPNFVAVTDLEGKITFCNEAPLKPLGLTLNDIVGKHKWDMEWWSYDPQLKASIKDMILRSAKGESFVVENNPKVGESPIPIKYTCSPLKDENGNVTEVILTGTPIIEQKQAMEMAQKQVTYLNNIPNFVAVTDLEGKITFCNETPLKPLGLTLNDIVGKHKWDMEWWSYDLQLRDSIKDMILRSAKGESFVVENNPKVGESPIPIKYTCSPLKDGHGNVTEVILTGTPIIEQKQAMEMAQKQVTYLNNIPNFVAVTDLEGKITFCNEAPLKPLGLTLNDIVGKHKWDMEWWSYDPQLKASIKDMILRSAKGESFVVENNPKVGESPIPIKYTCSPLKDGHGNVTEVILTGTPIVEQREAMEKMREQMQVIEAQRKAISDLSAPILQVWENVVCMPIIGALDTARSAMMTERLLSEVVSSRAQGVIIDLTGIDVVDTKIADHLIKLSKAVRLLGSEIVITGISPSIAQTLIHIGIEISPIKTLRNLQDGLKLFIKKESDETKDKE